MGGVATAISIQGLDVAAALKMVGSEAVYVDLLNNYYRVIPKKMARIQMMYDEENWRNYTIEVHALKSASRQIGANELADLAMQLEDAGNAGNIELIRKETARLLSMYSKTQELLAPYCQKNEDEKEGDRELTKDTLTSLLDDMLMAMDDLDMDAMNAVVARMKEYRYDDKQKGMFEQLREAVEDLDIDRCEDVIEAWRKL